MSVLIPRLVVVMLLLAAALPAAAEKSEFVPAIRVAASIYPLAHFAQKVGGSLVNVKLIMPAGSEPHTFEPGPSDIRSVYESALFIFHGSGLDSWAERIAGDIRKHGIITVETGRAISEDLSISPADPHFWLDPMLAIREVGIIRDALSKTDPGNRQTYIRNAAVYSSSIEKLDSEFKSSLKECRTRDIIVTHNAFGYIASRYNIKVHAIMGLTTEEEPSARRLAEIIRLSRRLGIKFIFYEKLVSSRYAQMVAEETGARVLVLDPAATLTKEEAAGGANYISIMRENLNALKKAMECE